MVGLSRVWLSLGLVVSLTASLLMGLPSQAGAVAGYGDVGEGTWYTNAVQWSTDNGIADIAGFCFGPDSPVSRGETAVWIYNMENQPDAGDSHSFSDVTDVSQNDAVSWMANNEITTGKSATRFAPDDTLNRAEAATFLHRLAGKPAAPPHNFVDVVATWQQGGVSWMADTGITTGKSPTRFAPDDTLTRAQLITFLYRYQGEPEVTLNTSTPNCDPTDVADPTNTSPTSFKAVSAGGTHNCGIRTNDTITCWGSNNFGKADAPAGGFKAVSASGTHNCGIRTNDTIACWGDNRDGEADPPAGGFKAVSAGGTHNCGIRTNDTIACWGDNRDGEADPPAGGFKAVSAGGDDHNHSCGIRTNDTITCWGHNRYGQTDAPEGGFKAVSAGGGHSCGIRTDNTITCWGAIGAAGGPAVGGLYNRGQADAPEGGFKAVSAGWSHSCGIRTDNTIICWGSNVDEYGIYHGQADAPAGGFKAVSAGWGHSCGIRTDNTIVCWGRNYQGQADAPTVSFQESA